MTVKSLEVREATLRAILSSYRNVGVAFSGGVDSSLLLAMAVEVLGAENVVALTADSPLLPQEELATAREIAKRLGVEHVVVPMDELQVPEISANVERRCYYCKRVRFEALLALTKATDATLIHGENADDHLDYRPGAAAAKELGVRAPLAEAGLTKADIRQLARRLGLRNWDQPAAACLASRFPYHTPLTRAGLERVERAERALGQIIGREQLRVRDHYPVARIELPTAVFAKLANTDVRAAISEALHAAGYHYVTVDLDGYRMGSLNEELK